MSRECPGKKYLESVDAKIVPTTFKQIRINTASH
jgi:hypothetical protein